MYGVMLAAVTEEGFDCRFRGSCMCGKFFICIFGGTLGGAGFGIAEGISAGIGGDVFEACIMRHLFLLVTGAGLDKATCCCWRE